MSRLRQALTDYLSIRRALGFKLANTERLLGQFITYLEQRRAEAVTVEQAVAWATLPEAASAPWRAMRLAVVRGFAVHLRTIDASTEVPPPGLLPDNRTHRVTPFLYSDTDIRALIGAAALLPRRVNAATYPPLVGLLAVTGMRVGEAIALDTGDFDGSLGVVTVREGKFGKSRILPLHPTTTAGLGRYLQARDRLCPAPATKALFISSVGKRMLYNAVQHTFSRIARQAGLAARSACRPRIHDLRHSFAVATLLDWYRRSEDVPALLPRLSTYLGHADPRHTFWYLSAAPELLALAGDRLDAHLRGAT